MCLGLEADAGVVTLVDDGEGVWQPDEGAETVRYRRDDLRIVVSGDLPAEEVLKILGSIPRIPSE